MDVLDAVRYRSSARRFIEKLVPRELIHEIIEHCRRAPSSMNTQPWEIWAVTGEPLAALKEANLSSVAAGDMAGKGGWARRVYEGVHWERQIGVAVQLYESLGIAPRYREARRVGAAGIPLLRRPGGAFPVRG